MERDLQELTQYIGSNYVEMEESRNQVISTRWHYLKNEKKCNPGIDL